MVRRIMFVFSFGFGLALSACVGQTPLLQVSNPQAAGPSWQVVVTNPYSEAATAFVLSMTSPDRPLPNGFPLTRHFEDSVPGSGGRPLGIAAGGTKTIALGGVRFKNVVYRIEAVIYADGSSAGDPALVNHILQVRRAALADIGAALSALGKAQTDPSLKDDVPGIVDRFREQARAHANQLSSGGQHLHTGDYVCELVWRNLDRPSPRASLGGEVAALSSVLTKWQQMLEQSKPSLAALSGPSLLQGMDASAPTH